MDFSASPPPEPTPASLERDLVAAVLTDGPSLVGLTLHLDVDAIEDPQARAWLAAVHASWTQAAVADVVSAAAAGGLDPEEGIELAATATTIDPASVSYWVKSIAERHRRRRTLNVMRSVSMALEADPTLELDQAVDRIVGEASTAGFVETDSIGDLAARVRDAPHMVPVPTGLLAVDDALSGGLVDGRLVVVAARPAMGKSSVGVEIVRAVAKQGRPCLIMSREMPGEELVSRVLQSTTGVDSEVFKDRPLPIPVLDAIDALEDLPIEILPYHSSTVAQLSVAARALAARTGQSPVILVDHIGLMSAPGAESRQLAVAALAEGLKDLAMREQSPVIALAQLNRGVEQRVDKRPMLSDLRESGAIEQSADVVMFLYRDEVYDPHTVNKNVLELIVAKNRSGSTKTVTAMWEASRFRFGKQIPNRHASDPSSTTF